MDTRFWLLASERSPLTGPRGIIQRGSVGSDGVGTSSDRLRVQVARGLGVSDNTVANRMAAARVTCSRTENPNGPPEIGREELAWLRRESFELRLNRE